MLLSISKYKLYLYLFFLIFLSSIFNFKFLENYQDMFSLKTINISGISYKEKKNIEEELSKLKNINIFKIKEDKVYEKLNKFKFIESINVKKIIPSSININLSKTSILGKTFVNGEEFYIGKNGEFINHNQIFEKYKIEFVSILVRILAIFSFFVHSLSEVLRREISSFKNDLRPSPLSEKETI